MATAMSCRAVASGYSTMAAVPTMPATTDTTRLSTTGHRPLGTPSDIALFLSPAVPGVSCETSHSAGSTAAMPPTRAGGALS
ncbi:hypothetical protein OH768_36945 [Streptomyces sp. NBC_01622]|uniref:hypothetical protein n=1 Tax=Streptomyces sp. NBC_01622 TaxID=2975903 RepID=UPI00386A9FDF|nr:hypothetical protein OH768_36945 [Streptomyces sp. NBC_01622]